MKRLLAGRRSLAAITVLALFAAPAILLGPRVVRAFTLPPDIIYFDPISVPVDHTLQSRALPVLQLIAFRGERGIGSPP